VVKKKKKKKNTNVRREGWLFGRYSHMRLPSDSCRFIAQIYPTKERFGAQKCNINLAEDIELFRVYFIGGSLRLSPNAVPIIGSLPLPPLPKT
jgi:hypothetical protein